LLIILALVGAVLYLNSVGLPGFVKRPLLEKTPTETRPGPANFTATALAGPSTGSSPKNVFFWAKPTMSPARKLTLKEVQLRLDYHALLKRRIQSGIAGLAPGDGSPGR